MPFIVLGSIIIAGIITLAVGWMAFKMRLNSRKRMLFPKELPSEKISPSDLDRFPELMKNYLMQTGVIGRSKYARVSFKQKGSIKTGPKKKWLSFKAIQHVSGEPSGFIWAARSFPLFIMDSYLEGKGRVLVNLLGLKNLTEISAPETHQSALGRYFGELLWFPFGFLDSDIEWQEINSTVIKGTIQKNGLSFDGFFHFSESGLIHSFKGKRYRDQNLEDFTGKAADYSLISGLLIPQKMAATWELETGPLEYFQATISDYQLLE